MPLDPQTAQTVVVLFGGIIIYRVTERLIDTAYRKLTGDCYITRTSHDECKAADQATAKALQEEMAVMRGILLVVAVKVGVDDRDLKRLAE
jgi:hypothetical protein